MPEAPRSQKQVFLDLLELEEAAREVELERLAAQPELAQGVRALLAAHARARTLLPGGGLAGPPARLSTGQRIGDYELLEVVGEGGAGVVYRARQVSLDRIVAIKVLRSGRFASAGELVRFRAEAELAARLDHPLIVPVFEIGELDGAPYFSMKLIEGASLAERVSDFAGDFAASAKLVAEIARAVHHGHQRGVLHRDLKPSNVLLDAAGRPHVADFGIAKRMDERGPRTFTGSFRGTPAYMAPEQVTGREVTVRTDVYALGGLLYELLTGRPPVEGQGLAQILRGVQELEPPPARSIRPNVPRDLGTIAQKCLAKDPARRYGSAEELARELQRWAAGEPIEARPVSFLERAWLFGRRRPLVASLMLTVAVLTATLAVGATLTSVRLGEHLTRAREAEDVAKERLRATLLAGARLNRASLRPGRRSEALGLLREAALLRSGPDLLDEAIACVALPELVVEREWLGREGSLAIAFDARLERQILRAADGRVSVQGPGEHAQILPGSAGPRPWVGAYSQDGTLLALKRHARHDREEPLLEVWDLARGSLLLRRAEAVSGRALAIDPGGGMLAYGTRDAQLVLVDLPSGRERARIPLAGDAHELRFDPRGARLALASAAGFVELRSGSSGALEQTFEHGSIVYSLDFCPDGRRLLTGGGDFGVHLWELESGAHLQRLDGHQAEVVHVRASPDGRWWISYAWDETALLWDARSAERLLAASAKPLEFSADGARLAFTTSDTVGVWKLAGGEAVATLYGHEGKSPITLDVSPDGASLASGGPDGVLVRALGSGQVAARLDVPAVKAVRFDPAGNLFVASEEQGLLRFAQGARAAPELLFPGRCPAVAIPDTGAWIAALVGGEILLLDPAGELRVRSAGHMGLHRLAASADGRWLGGGNWQGEGALIFDPESGAVLTDLAPGERGVELAFDPAGERIVVATGRAYRIHRGGSFELEREIPREIDLAARPGAAAFSPDGRILALALTHRVVSLYDPERGEPLARLEPPLPQPLSELRFTPDGTRLVVGTQTRRVEIWHLAGLAEALRGAGLGALADPLAAR